MEEKEIICTNINLTGLVKFLNDKFGKKESGKLFTKSDCQQYVNRKKLPEYMGNYSIERIENIESVKLYNVIKN